MAASPWIEAMRLRTLPVSCAGVFAASAMALLGGCFRLDVAIICLLFAISAQIASNFANEYYDYKAGIDKPGREGPRRGVTEGDISPTAMKYATLITVGFACGLGLSLLTPQTWWLIFVGIGIVAGLFAYSAGPYPLSRHALGEAAVVVFFGIVPVNFTFFVQAGHFDLSVAMMSVAIGLMGANILIVNNYRDAEDDRSVGKHTLATKFGTTFASWLYLVNGYFAIGFISPIFFALPLIYSAAPIIYLMIHTCLWLAMSRRSGAALNPLLGMTAINMFLFSILMFLPAILGIL